MLAVLLFTFGAKLSLRATVCRLPFVAFVTVPRGRNQRCTAGPVVALLWCDGLRASVRVVHRFALCSRPRAHVEGAVLRRVPQRKPRRWLHLHRPVRQSPSRALLVTRLFSGVSGALRTKLLVAVVLGFGKFMGPGEGE